MHCGHALNTADEFIKGKCYECQQDIKETGYVKDLQWYRINKKDYK